MAAGGTAASSHGSRGSAAALELSLDRRFQVVTNTMESIQGLSTWCIDNKKYHNNIVRAWLKWIKKSEPPHRLSLFYLANDVIQNCKRKNAIVYRTSFTTVLPDAMEILNGGDDPKLRRAVERTLAIWEERNVYSEEFIAQLRTGLQEKEPEEPAVSTPVVIPAPPKVSAAQKSKIVAEFVPQSFVQKLQKYRSSVDEVDLREKQLAAMRVDVCSSDALKKLKDKAGGKKFAKDFEEGSAKLQEFVSILEGQVKKGPVLLEALQNADVFYEMQYKEVKIVTKAYETFANRVNHLKRKLDTLKTTLPSLDDSPVPSPCADAPSPTGSESPFHGLCPPDPALDGAAMDDDHEALIPLGDAPSPLSSAGGSPKPEAEAVGQTDNIEVEDMELSDVEEAEEGGIIVEEQMETPIVPVVSNPISAPIAPKPTLTNEVTSVKHTALPSEASAAVASVPAPVPAASTAAAAPVATTVTPAVTAAAIPANLANVDLGKISSILNSIMKNTGVSPGCRPSSESPVAPTTPAGPQKTPAPTPQSSSDLASILSKVDTNTILSALSKTQGQSRGLPGFSSVMNNQGVKTTASAPGTAELPNTSFLAPSNDPIPTTLHPTSSLGPPLMGNSSKLPSPASNAMQTRQLPENPGEKVPSKSASLSSSIDSRLHNFIQGNQGLHDFNLGFNTEPLGLRGSAMPIGPLGQIATGNSPSLGQENTDGTPVRDESGSTPTQDEVSDASANILSMFQGGAPKTGMNNPTSNPSSSQTPAYESEFWRNSNSQPSMYGTPNGTPFRQGGYNGMGRGSLPSGPGSELDQFQSQVPNSGPGGKLPPDSQAGPAGSRLDSKGGWYGQPYMDEYSDSNVAATSLNYGREPRDGETAPQSTSLSTPGFFNSPLPPIPQLPPPPKDLLAGPSPSRPGPEPVAKPPDAPGHPDEYHDPTHFEPVREDLLLPYPDPEEEMGHPGEPPFSRPHPYPHPHPHHSQPPGPGLDGGPRPGPAHGLDGGPRPPLHHPPIGPPHHLPRRAGSPPPGPLGDYYDSHSPPPPHLRRGYYEDRSPSPPPFEDPYYDRYYDREARSPSPPPYPYRRPLSPHGRRPEFDVFDYDHDLPPPEHRLPPHPFHPRPPRPMLPTGPIPQRPLGPRRPMPPRLPPHHPHDPYRMPMKRPGPPFGGPPRGGGGPFFPPKRPFLPPRY